MIKSLFFNFKVEQFKSSLPLLFILTILSSCTTTNDVKVLRKEQLYYEKSGTVKLVRLSRKQSIKELANTYEINAELLARANGRKIEDSFEAGEIIKVPLSKDIQFEELVFDSNSIQDYNIEIQSDSLVEDNKQSLDSQIFDEELNKDLENFRNASSDVNSKAKNPAAEATKSIFKTTHPLNLKQFNWPLDCNSRSTQCKILSRYGKQGDSFNEGINIEAPIGTVISSAGSGKVVFANNEPKLYGNLVIIKHTGGYMTAYGHCDKMHVKKDEKVVKGGRICTVGKTGAVSKPQLHFSISKNGKTLDPENSN
jgi:murein DD-endopeptidase MepM/ murein hydrolase activator NlpD